MRIDSVTPGAVAQTTTNKGLTQQDFMQLLVTQLAGQNPLQPMDDNQLFQQIATMGNIQGIDEMRAATEMSRAQGMLGHTVDYLDGNGALHNGVVSKLTFDGNSVLLTVGTDQIPASGVKTDYGVMPKV